MEIAPEPVVPDGWEVVVSAAYPGVPGRSRAEFLAEVVGLRRSIVVGGTHGKGTTAAMIAFVLRETGRDPAWLIGSPVPQLGRTAARGRGGSSSRATSPTLGLRAARHDRGRDQRRARPPHRVRVARRAGGRVRRVDGPRGRGRRDAPAFAGELAVAGEFNRQNAGSALAALEAAGVPRDEAEPVLARFTGTGRRFEVSEAGGVTIVDDYGHHPSELAATIAAVREAYPADACTCSSSRTSTPARGISRASSAPRWRRPTTSR